jgi:hypothetical protein
VSNINWIKNFVSLDGLQEPHPDYYVDRARLILKELSRRSVQIRLQDFCVSMDASHGLEVGTTLLLVRHLLASKAIVCNMHEPIDDAMPIGKFSVAMASRTRAAV